MKKNITENDVEADIIGFLVRRGWIMRRQHSAVARTMSGHALRLGEPGMCDWSAMRPSQLQDVWMDKKVEYLEVEVKRPGGRLRPEQREYIAKRLHQGILATWADSLELFAAWYRMEGFE